MTDHKAMLELERNYPAKPDRSLVERVADTIAELATSAGIVNTRPARAAILEVAVWLSENSGGTRAAWMLEREAER